MKATPHKAAPSPRTMLVTGASSGIGRALTIRAARAGYRVYAVGRDRAALATLREKIVSEGGTIAVEAIDIAVTANAYGIVARTLAAFGSIDVLVNNAGFVSAGSLCAQPDEELQRQFATHVTGPVALVREALEALRAAGGTVFLVGSGVARIPLGGLGAYPPAKAAIRSAAAILRRELLALGIAVTYVDPGAVDTPFMTRAGMPGAPSFLLTSPENVARKMLVAVGRRPAVLNVVGWQTTLVALAERFPRITEALIARAPGLVGGGEGASPLAQKAGGAPTLAPFAVPSSSAPTERAAPIERTAAIAKAASEGAAIERAGLERGAIDGAATADSAVSDDEPAATSAPATAAAFASDRDNRDEAIESTTVAPNGAQPEAAENSTPLTPQPATFEATTVAAEPAETTASAQPGEISNFALALEPHRRRMGKLNLTESFVRNLLVPGARLEPGEVALRWAGMPNKNERGITEEVLDALHAAGFLERSGDGYRVIASAEELP